MRRLICPLAGITACLGLVVGCNSPGQLPAHSIVPVTASVGAASVPQAALSVTTSPSSGDEIVARIVGNTGGVLNVPRSELDAALYDAFGLQFLFDVVELDLAKATLGRTGMTLQPSDVERERQLVLKKLCGDADPADYEKLFEQFLQRQHLTRTEFDIRAVKINACLRKIVEPATINSLTDEAVHKGFEQIYGQKRQIADIQVDTLKDAAEARRRLAAGVPFEQAAQQMSTDNATAPLGGLWQPFSSQSPKNVVPDAIKEAAFALERKGQVCPDILQAGTSYHIIKLIDVIEPKVMRYEDVKDSVRRALEDRVVEIKMKALRDEITQLAQQQIEIEQPTLKGQWDKILEAHRPASVDRDKVLNKMDKDHEQGAIAPADRSSATMPGATAPGTPSAK